ncbi:MAG: hypothetical protein P4N59_32760 [Negativicutes bacterium]|nr:hypothetical protein [Negativicutes bacterium]
MASGKVNKTAPVEISIEDMLEKMTKVLSAEEVDFWSDCADQLAVLSEVVKSSPHLSDKQKMEKLDELLNEYGYFTE